MTPERWRQIDELLDAVLDLPEVERDGFLSEQCGGDEDLRTEVLSLLKAQTGSNDFLETSAMRIAAKNLAEDDTILYDAYFLGKTIGTYKIEKLIGAGGMGEVYLATDEKLNRKVALKILPPEYTSHDERLKRFQLEARAISILNHPNIVTIYDVGSFEGVNYIATEYVEGETFRDLIKKRPKLKEILANMTQVCSALSAAHQAGIIHRDIKPENIMLRPDGYVKILDFGLAKLTDISPQTLKNLAQTAKGIIIGTPAYMSPKQVSDERLDHRTDLWSVGVVLYELITGTNPFKKTNRQATFQAIVSEDPPLASSYDSDVSDDLDRILLKALEKDPDISYQTASDMQADIRRVRREIDSSPSLRSGSSSKKTKKKSRSVLAWASGIFILLLAASGIWFFFFYDNQKINAPDWTRAQNIPLSVQAGTEFYPSLSPDGKSFVFALATNNVSDIYSQRVGGKNSVNLTENSPADDTQPAFSPDGEYIAFRSEREPRGVYVMGASGENPRRVADFGFYPAWSPDGNQIAVSTNRQDIPSLRNRSAIWIINVESGEKRLLIDKYAMQPAWSPNEKFIAYWFTESGGRRSVAVIPADGGDPITVAEQGNTNWNPVWSPDGNFLYFASDRGGSMAFWRRRIDQNSGKPLGEAEYVPTPAKYNRHLSFSADGKRMVYVQTMIQANLKAVEFDPKTEKMIGEPKWITNGDREIYLHELSPDGRTFVMRNITPTQEDLMLLDRDGTNPRELTNDEFFDRYARWSPDGKKIIFTSDRNGKYNLWMINADGTNLKQITDETEKSPSIPAWSPDGKRISYDNTKESFIYDLSNPWSAENLKKLPSPGENSFFRAWDWSPDGKKIIGYFEGGNNEGMAVYFFETNSFEKLNNHTSFNFWFPDNRRIIYSVDGKPYITDTETKKEREIEGLSREYIRHIRISRDGKLLSYTVLNSESDIWLLDLTQN